MVYKLSPSGHESVLYTLPGGANGANPYAGVIADASGNLYGVTSGDTGSVYGVIYKLDAANNYTVLHSFTFSSHLGKPEGGLIRDSAGNLYGTTQYGGPAGMGVVYRLSTAGKLKTLCAFPGGGYGLPQGPTAGVTADASGSLYGATAYAGVGGMVYRLNASGQVTTLIQLCGSAERDSTGRGPRPRLGRQLGGAANQGVVFKVDTAGREMALYSFTGGADGANPESTPVLDSAGNLYGTALGGGVAFGAGGHGVAYKIDASGRHSVLYAFTGGADGGLPEGGLAIDSAGYLYGTASEGGTAGAGVLYKLDPSGRQTVLHSFTGGGDGGDPIAGVTLDSAGNFYGTTYYGGSAGYGVIYRVDPSGSETVLYSFPGGPSGALPYAGVIRDSAGNLYGTTAGGGGSQGESGAGVVYKLDSTGQETVLYAFTGGSDGGFPLAGVIRDSVGNLYGTTGGGGLPGCLNGCGVVYKLDTSGRQAVLCSFSGSTDGANPYAGVVADAAGNLYGTTPWGGKGGFSALSFSGAGVVYRVSP